MPTNAFECVVYFLAYVPIVVVGVAWGIVLVLKPEYR